MPAEARDEIPALYARLQDEVLRSEAAARPLVRRPGVRGAVVYAAKRLLRPEPRPRRARPVDRDARAARRRAACCVLQPDAAGAVRHRRLLGAAAARARQRLVDVDVAPRGKRARRRRRALPRRQRPGGRTAGSSNALRREPGVVVLHDFVLHHLVAGMTLGRKDERGLPRRDGARRRASPGRLLGLGVIDGCIPPLWEVRPEDFPLCGEVLDLATGVIVHSRYVEERVRERGYDGAVWRIPHPAWPAPDVEPERSPGEPVFGAFGNLNARSACRSCSTRSRAFANRIPTRACCSSAQRHPASATRIATRLDARRARGLRRRGAALGADGRRRRRRLAPLADDGRDVGHRRPRALARQAAARQRRRLVLGAARRRRAEGRARRRRGRTAGGRDGALADPARARADGRDARELAATSTTSSTSPELYAAALQEAAEAACARPQRSCRSGLTDVGERPGRRTGRGPLRAQALVARGADVGLARRHRRRLGGDSLRARAPDASRRGSWWTSSSTRSWRRASPRTGTSSSATSPPPGRTASSTRC